MIVLDTDHVSELQRRDSKRGIRLLNRLAQRSDEPVAVTIASVEEQLRGRLAMINQIPAGTGQILPYGRLIELLEFYSDLLVLPFDQTAAQHFIQIRQSKVRVGTMDLKIAAIVLAHKGPHLSANLRDFKQVPNLQVEDWLSEE